MPSRAPDTIPMPARLYSEHVVQVSQWPMKPSHLRQERFLGCTNVMLHFVDGLRTRFSGNYNAARVRLGLGHRLYVHTKQAGHLALGGDLYFEVWRQITWVHPGYFDAGAVICASEGGGDVTIHYDRVHDLNVARMLDDERAAEAYERK